MCRKKNKSRIVAAFDTSNNRKLGHSRLSLPKYLHEALNI